jgi:hypothetical protein
MGTLISKEVYIPSQLFCHLLFRVETAGEKTFLLNTSKTDGTPNRSCEFDRPSDRSR